MSPSNTYPPSPPPPPPPRRRTERSSSPSAPESSTLYAQSPHAPIDKRAGKRRAASSKRSDPTFWTLLILALGLLWFFLPAKHRASVPAVNLLPTCVCPEPQKGATMVFQKTITLSQRSKGCHLVTEEVTSQLGEGLKGVKVSSVTSKPILS